MSGREISSAAELDALPVGSVVLDLGPNRAEATAPVIACKAARGDWQVLGDDPARRWRSHEISDVARPNVLTVLHRPDVDLFAAERERGARSDEAFHRMQATLNLQGEYDPSVLPGGFVCPFCREPWESEPWESEPSCEHAQYVYWYDAQVRAGVLDELADHIAQTDIDAFGGDTSEYIRHIAAANRARAEAEGAK